MRKNQTLLRSGHPAAGFGGGCPGPSRGWCWCVRSLQQRRWSPATGGASGDMAGDVVLFLRTGSARRLESSHCGYSAPLAKELVRYGR